MDGVANLWIHLCYEHRTAVLININKMYFIDVNNIKYENSQNVFQIWKKSAEFPLSSSLYWVHLSQPQGLQHKTIM